MSIIYRNGLGRKLTPDEVDGNFQYLDDNKVEQSDIDTAVNSAPVSPDQQAALDLKADQADFSNVDNTSDANKEVSIPQQTALDTKQNTLVSGTNIKTINGETVLGSGDIAISGSTPEGFFSPDKYGTIEVPSGFVHPLAPFNIVRYVDRGAVLLSHNKDTYRKLLTTPSEKYVDQINGLDTNTGDSWAQAYKTFEKARTTGFDRCYLTSGNYASLNNIMFNVDREVICVNGRANLAYGFIGNERTWTDETGGTWSNVITASPKVVIDSERFDSEGKPFRLTRAVDLADCLATSDSYFKDSGSGKLYVHTDDGLTPDKGSLLFSLDRINLTNGKTNYAEGVRFISGLSLGNSTATPNVFTGLNCEFAFCLDNNSCNLNGNVTAYLEGCEAYKAKFDGFNYHQAGAYNPAIIEVGCSGFNNGENNTSGINNGSTAHETVKVLRIKGVYHSNEGPNVHDVNNAQSLNVDCIAYNSVSTVAGNKSDFAVAAGSSEVCEIWLDGCTTRTDGTFGAENRSSLAGLFARNSNIVNIESGTTVTPY